ncbi:MAG TPA: hypothetical protein PKA06_06850 [Gemmatales bacterium]|nr:hypothetical protein [Gemmatales bacterium]
MSPITRSVPFTINSLYAGLGQCHGMVFDEGDHLRFEYQIQDTFGGVFKGGVKQFRVPVTEIIAVDLVKGWLGFTRMGVKIVMQSNNLHTFKPLPGSSQGKIELKVTASNAPLAEEFVNGLYRQE